ncbi:peptidase C1 [Candidatus Sumerlaeota bacterium]|nr:peptidase C1 [Candidatus Sumerlaeota bacterium]
MKRIILSLTFILLLWLPILYAGQPNPDKALFVEKKDEFKEQLQKRAARMDKKKADKDLELKMDASALSVPESPEIFTQAWSHPPVSQDLTGSCWAFSSTSFFECEIYRLSKRKIKLSEMFTVYWEYVEKARQFVRKRGDSHFGKGSQPNAAIRIWKRYGVVPAQAYGSIDPEKKIYQDGDMFTEMETFLESIKERNEWNEKHVIETIKSILNRYMGVPPVKIDVDGKQMTPGEYLDQVLGLILDDYVDMMSLMQAPFYQKVEYKVWDNWWGSRDYYNVPLDDFIDTIRKAAREGYTLCIAGDNSEAGFLPLLDCAVIPGFDILSQNIDDSARQFRFSNESTSDDHAIHLVGYLEKDGETWYLIKDSSTKARNGRHKGYMFYREDFVKLKMMNIMVHKDAVRDLMPRFEKENKAN